ncbi:uncharacterized protein [Parasteatoda tepidariorum]|uniref:uncharacterized protein n=1 Tax=Parasteatoda tepidariorum TaxID=114398 RepID=UPI0039BC3C02
MNGYNIFWLRINADEYLDPRAQPAIYFNMHDSRRLVNPFKHGIRLGVPGYHFIKVTEYVNNIFWLRINADEYLDPRARPAIYFSIHDSRRLVNPFKHGIRLGVPGYHFIKVTEYVEQHLLPHPYDTKCTFFNPKGSTDENVDIMDCIETCTFNLHMEQYGCAPRSISISHMANLCKKGEKVQGENRNICFKMCNNTPCETRWFTYKHLQTVHDDLDYGYQERKILYPRLYNISQFAYVGVSFRNARIRIINFVPRMMPMELFSNIGGFLGIWIGSSIISISDLLYKLSEYIYTYFIKFAKTKSRTRQS